jgi:hypothetical protein
MPVIAGLRRLCYFGNANQRRPEIAMRTLFVLLVAVALANASAEDAKLVLFNGKDLTGWVAEGAKEYKDKATGELRPVWSVNKEGNLFCDGSGFGFLRYDGRRFSDFRFHVEYRMTKKCNSGIGIRTTKFDPKQSKGTRPSFAAYEIQLLDDAGKKPDAHSTGSLYRYVAPSSNPGRPVGEWNAMDIECIGPRIRITFNGEKIIDVDQSTIAELKDKPLDGYLCLQNHGGKLEFRNVWVTDLTK